MRTDQSTTDIILLEDEPVLCQELGDFLTVQGYRAQCTTSLEDFQRHFDANRHSLAIIDIGLPDGNGLHLIQQLRQSGHQLGIIVFSARGTSADRISGLDIGADHYLAKGCDLDELAATLAALARRLELRRLQACWLLEIGPRLLKAPVAPAVPLSQQDLLVLRCLMEKAGENVSRSHIIQSLGSDELNYDQRRLDTQMRRLRRRVGEISGQELPVKTLRNSGYCFHAKARILP